MRGPVRIAIVGALVALGSSGCGSAAPTASEAASAQTAAAIGPPPSPTPSATPSPPPSSPSPTPSPPPNPLGLLLRERILAFAAAAPAAAAKITRTVPTVDSVSHIAPKWRTLIPLRQLLTAEADWETVIEGVTVCYSTGNAKESCVPHSPIPGIEVDRDACPLYRAWEGVQNLYEPGLSKADHAISFLSQRQLDKARREILAATTRLVGFAALVRDTQDPCAIAEIP